MRLAEQLLKGCRLLLVRPSSGDRQLQQLIAQQAGLCEHIPVMTLETLAQAPQRIAELQQQMASGSLAIFVSRTAATIVAQQLPKWSSNLRCFAVGQSTAAVLAQVGLAVVAPTQEQTSEGLLALPELQRVSAERAVIVAGEGGRHLIGEQLTARGAVVSRCELYRRQITPDGQLVAKQSLGRSDLLLAHSGELLSALGRPPHADIALVVPSLRVAELGSALGYVNIQVAKSAAAPAMLDAAVQAWQQQNNLIKIVPRAHRERV